MTCNLVLASASPRRRELLENAGIKFTIRVAPVVERRGEKEDPSEYVMRLAREKAIAANGGIGEVVLGADTTVVVDGHVLEKPTDTADAARMIGLLQGRTHEVMTGICLWTPERAVTECEITRVRFRSMSPAEVDAYVATSEPYDKAGAYAIQGLASKFIDRVEGCYFNVVGLPVAKVYAHLREFGVISSHA